MQSLRLRLIAPFIVGTLLLTIILAGYTYISGRKAIENATLLISEAQVNQTFASMNMLFNSLNTNIQNMIGDSHIKSLFSADASEETTMATVTWLNILTSGNEYYRDIFIVDKNGLCIASSNPSHIGESYAHEAYIQQALKGRFNYGAPSVGKVTLRFSASVAGPISVDSKIVGALILQNDFPKIVDYREHTAFEGQTMFTSMLTPNGLFMAHKNKKIMQNNNLLRPDLYKKLLPVALRGGVVAYTFQNDQYIGYAKLEPSTKWIILNSGKESEVFAVAYKTGLVVLGISCLFLCLITIIVVRFANNILNSLLSLIAYTKKVSEGELELELGTTDRKDELGVLHNSLQRLVSFLQAMILETQKASKMKGEFLANMSHEIRTPLNAIISMAHLVLREKNLTERVHDFTRKSQISAHSLLGLINDILDISKVEAGMLELEIIPFNLKEVANNVLLIHQEQAKSKGIALHHEYPDDMPKHYLGDPLRIGQILNNLLSNALKFTKEGEVIIYFSIAPVPDSYVPNTALIGEKPSESICVHICVHDTGIGMPDNVTQSLFKPFMQADASITRKFGGTGLGLAISKHLVTLLHGDFSVTSTIGKGAQFSFFMQLTPITDAQDDELIDFDLETSFESLNLTGKTILVAEDNQLNQLIMDELLQPTGAKIIMANNGQEAVDFLQEGLVDLVFMDLQMPVLDGLEATTLIRKFASADVLPIVAVTANAMTEDREKGFACGMNSYITKPIEPKHLFAVLRDWFK